MAQKQEEKQSNPIYDEFMREQNKRTLADKRGELEEKLDAAMDRYLELKEQYGEDNIMTKFQAQMINILIPLNEFCTVVLTMEEAVIMLDETLCTIDDALDMINGCLMHNNKRYGFFDGIKQRRTMRKYWKAWNGRIKRITYIYGSMMGNSQKLYGSISKMTNSMNTQKSKKKGGVSSSGFSPEAQELLNRKLARKNGTEIESASAGATDEPAAPAPASDGAPGVDGLM